MTSSISNSLKHELFSFSTQNSSYALCNKALGLKNKNALTTLKVQLSASKTEQKDFWQKMDLGENFHRLKKVKIICDKFYPYTLDLLSGLEKINLKETNCTFNDVVHLLEKGVSVKLKGGTLLQALQESIRSGDYSNIALAIGTSNLAKGEFIEFIEQLMNHAKNSEDWSIFEKLSTCASRSRRYKSLGGQIIDLINNEIKSTPNCERLHAIAKSNPIPEGASVPSQFRNIFTQCRTPPVLVRIKDENNNEQSEILISYPLAVRLPPVKMVLEANMKEVKDHKVEFHVSKKAFDILHNFVIEEQLPKLSIELIYELAVILDMYPWPQLQQALEKQIQDLPDFDFSPKISLTDMYKVICEMPAPPAIFKKYERDFFFYKLTDEGEFKLYESPQLEDSLTLLKRDKITPIDIVIDANAFSSQLLETALSHGPFENVRSIEFKNCSDSDKFCSALTKFSVLAEVFPNVKDLYFDSLPKSDHDEHLDIFRQFPKFETYKLLN